MASCNVSYEAEWCAPVWHSVRPPQVGMSVFADLSPEAASRQLAQILLILFTPSRHLVYLPLFARGPAFIVIRRVHFRLGGVASDLCLPPGGLRFGQGGAALYRV